MDQLTDIDAMLAPPTVHRATQQFQRNSPIRRVPHELLRYIFLEIFEDPDPQCLNSSYPLVLSWVCVTWREVALSISELWAIIPMVFPRPYALPLVEAYLTRSHKQILDIVTVHVDGGEDMRADDEVRVGSSLMQLLLPHIGRWSTITIRPEHPSTTQRMLSMISGTADCLEHMEISGECVTCHHQEMYAVPYVIPPSFLAPRLVSLRLNRYPHEWQAGSFGHITSMDRLRIQAYSKTVGPTLLSLLPLLGSLERLRYLSLNDVMECTVLQTDKSNPMCLPHLQKVSLFGVTEDTIANFLSIFKAPELTSMSFEHIIPVDDSDQLALTFSWLDRRGRLNDRFPKLHHFEIRNRQATSAITILFAPFITSLTLNLHVYNPGLEEWGCSLVEVMGRSFHSDRWWTCPALKSLLVLGGTDTKIAALRRMVEARLIANSRTSPLKPSAIKFLRLLGSSILEEDREWFSGHVETFTTVADLPGYIYDFTGW